MSTYKVTFDDWSGKSHTLAGNSPEAIAREMSVRGYAGPPIPLRCTLDGSTYGLVSADLFEHTPEELERRRVEYAAARTAAAEAASALPKDMREFFAALDYQDQAAFERIGWPEKAEAIVADIAARGVRKALAGYGIRRATRIRAVFDQHLGTRAFLAHLEAVCRKHGLSIAHEDGHGSFLVTKWNEGDSAWLAAAKPASLADRGLG